MFGSTSLFAQVDDNGDDKKDGSELQEEIKIFKNYIPEISRVNKINYNPLFLDSVYIKENLNYKVKKYVLPIDENNHPLSSIEYKEPLLENHSSYILLGFANKMQPLGELSLSNDESEKWKYGLFFRHFSEDRDENDIFYESYSHNKGRAYVDFMDNGQYFKADFGYERRFTDGILDREMKQHFLNGDFSYKQIDSDKLFQALDFSTKYGLKDSKNSEIQLNLNSKWNMNLGRNKLKWDLNFVTVDNELSDASLDKDGRLTNIALQPTLYGKSGKFHYQLGFKSYLIMDDESNSEGDLILLPNIYTSMDLSESTNIFLGFTGDYSLNTYWDALYESPYIINTLSQSLQDKPFINSSYTPIDVYAGIKSNCSGRLKFNFTAHYKKIDRFQYLQSIPIITGGITVDRGPDLDRYQKDLDLITAEMNANYILNSKTNLRFNTVLNIFDEEGKNGNPAIAHMPKFTLSVTPEHQLNEQFKIYGKVGFTDKQNAFVYAGNKDEIDSFMDLSLGGQYNFSNKLQGTLEVRNLLDNKIETYQGYTTNGLNAFISLRFKF